MAIRPVGFFSEIIEMLKRDRYDSLIRYYSEKNTQNKMDWLVFKAMIKQESNFNRYATSVAGACGLMQIMPETAKDLGMVDDLELFDAEWNIDMGTAYLWYLYGKYEEIPDCHERLCFALAAYNAGRRNINEMLEHARLSFGHPPSYSDWKKMGSLGGEWQKWHYSKRFLTNVTGECAKETLNYVSRVERYYHRLFQT